MCPLSQRSVCRTNWTIFWTMETLMKQKTFFSSFTQKMTMKGILTKKATRLWCTTLLAMSRKTVAKNACTSCAAELCVSQKEAMNDVNSYFTAHFDNGGLIYPTDNLAKTVAAMEDAFTSFFSKNSVHEKSMQEFARSLQSSKLP
ncbi:unnamed protein product, partial [Ixodes pacificus]